MSSPEGPIHSNPNTRRPLWRFLRIVLLGCVGLVLLHALVTLLCIGVLQIPILRYFTLPDETRVLYSGDSHVGCTFVENRPTHCLLWNSGTSPMMTLLRLKKVEQCGWPKNLKTVVTEVGEQTCILEHDKGRLRSQRSNAFMWAWSLRGALPEERPFRFFVNWWRQAAKKIASYTVLEPVPTLDKPFSERPPEEIEDSILRGIEWFAPENFSEVFYQERLVAMQAGLLALKDFCEARGVRLILFSAPVYPEVQKYLAPVWKQRFVEQQAWIRAQGFEYYDYRGKMDGYWMRDSGHLRPSGAKIFTDFFLKEHGLE